MGDTETMTREQELQEEFKAGLEPDAMPQLAARIAGLEAQVADHAAEKAEWEKQRDSLLVDTAAALAARDKAEAATKRAKAKVTAGDVPERVRKLKADAFDGDRDTLKEKLATADKVEIAFSDGRHEVPGVAPLTVEGEVWRDHQLGLMLRDPVTVTGPSTGTSTTIAGYALLIDGKQVAYTERSDPLNIAPGQKVSLADDIYF